MGGTIASLERSFNHERRDTITFSALHESMAPEENALKLAENVERRTTALMRPHNRPVETVSKPGPWKFCHMYSYSFSYIIMWAALSDMKIESPEAAFWHTCRDL